MDETNNYRCICANLKEIPVLHAASSQNIIIPCQSCKIKTCIRPLFTNPVSEVSAPHTSTQWRHWLLVNKVSIFETLKILHVILISDC